MKKIKLYLLATTIYLLFVAPVSAFAANKFWIGPADADFSDNANWSTTNGGANNTTAPGASDVAIFANGGNTNASMTGTITLQGLTIQTGYSSTITMAAASTLTLTNTTTPLNMQTGNTAIFDATNATSVTMVGSLTINAGTFKSPTGTLNLNNNAGFTKGTSGTFVHNNGSVNFGGTQTGTSTISLSGGDVNFYNLTVNRSSGVNSLNLNTSDAIIGGTLTLTDGRLGGSSSLGVVIDNNLSIAATFDGITAKTLIRTSSNFTYPENRPCGHLAVINTNKSDIILSTTGSTALNCLSLTLTGSTFNNTANVDLNFSSGAISLSSASTMNAGNTTVTAGTITTTGSSVFDIDSGSINASGALAIGGNFELGTATLSTTSSITVNSNTFNATNSPSITAAGTLTLNGTSIFQAPTLLTIQNNGGLNKTTSATFTHNNGTVSFTGTQSGTSTINLAGSNVTFNNIIINRSSGANSININSNSAIIIGTLTLTDGRLGGSATLGVIIDGNISIASTFDEITARTIIRKSVDFVYPTDRPCGHLGVQNTNKSDIIVSTTGTSALNCLSLHVNGGTFDNTADIDMNFTGSGSGGNSIYLESGTIKLGDSTVYAQNSIEQDAGLFDGETSDLTIGNNESGLRLLDINAGTFNGGNSIDLNSGTGQALALVGTGTFNAPNTFYLSASGITSSTTVFNHNNGLFVFDGGVSASFQNNISTGLNFYNLTVNKNEGVTYTFSGSNPTNINGTLTLQNGIIESNSTNAITANNLFEWQNTVDSAAGLRLTLKTTTNETLPNGFSLDTLNIDNTNKADLVISTAGSSTATINGQISLLGGTFNNSGNANITIQGNGFASGLSISNGTFNAGYGSLITLNNADFVMNNGTFDGQSSYLLLSGASSDIDFNNGTFIGGSNIEIQGFNTSSGSSLDLDGGTFTAPSVALYLARDFDQAAGATFNHNNGSIVFNGSNDADIILQSGTSLFDVTINKDIQTRFLRLLSATDINGDLNLTTGDFRSNNFNLNLAGDWNRGLAANTIYTPGTSTIILDGTNQTINGSNIFYRLTKTVTSEDTLNLEDGETQTITNIWTAQGASGQKLLLRSTSNGNQWYIDPQGTRTIAYLDVRDSNNSNLTAINTTGTNSTDSGNNTNWTFPTPPNVPSSLGPASLVNGSLDNDTTPTLQFTLTDPTIGYQVKYRIQIDNDSDFSSPIVDYTSALNTQGVQTFTVGQLASGGVYLVGNSGQSLAQGSYYWRVKNINQDTVESLYTTANSGSIAFIIDTEAPLPVTQLSPTDGSLISDPTPLFIWTDLDDETSYVLEIATDSNFTNIVDTININANDTSVSAGSPLAMDVYYWRIYGIDQAGNFAPEAANYQSFEIISAIPEFPTYLMSLILVLSTGFIYFSNNQNKKFHA